MGFTDSITRWVFRCRLHAPTYKASIRALPLCLGLGWTMALFFSAFGYSSELGSQQTEVTEIATPTPSIEIIYRTAWFAPKIEIHHAGQSYEYTGKNLGDGWVRFVVPKFEAPYLWFRFKDSLTGEAELTPEGIFFHIARQQTQSFIWNGTVWSSLPDISNISRARIDSHTHPRINDPALHRRMMEVENITAIVGSQPSNQARFLEFSRQEGNIFPLFWVRPVDKPQYNELKTTVEEARAAIAQGFVGFKMHPHLDQFFADDSSLSEYFRLAQELDVPIAIHTDTFANQNRQGYNFAHPGRILTRLKEFTHQGDDQGGSVFGLPPVRIILYHADMQNAYADDLISLVKAAHRENLQVYLEPSWNDTAKILRLIHEVGSQWILFGTDGYSDNEHWSKPQVFKKDGSMVNLSTILSDLQLELVEHSAALKRFMALNAIRILNLGLRSISVSTFTSSELAPTNPFLSASQSSCAGTLAVIASPN